MSILHSQRPVFKEETFMKNTTFALGLALLTLGSAAQAQNVYGGVGLPGVLTLGYAQPMGKSWGLRGEFAGGTSVSRDGVEEGVNYEGTIKSNRVGAFADWFPLNSGFRLVGGLTFNNTKAEFNATGTGTNTINDKPVNLAGETFNVRLKYPKATPYLGIGYGHQASKVKGLGFFADIGVTVGKFKTEVETTLVGQQGITQADVDAEVRDLRDAVNKLSVLPSLAAGLVYRF
jgi:hypothetical protein